MCLYVLLILRLHKINGLAAEAYTCIPAVKQLILRIYFAHVSGIADAAGETLGMSFGRPTWSLCRITSVYKLEAGSRCQCMLSLDCTAASDIELCGRSSDHRTSPSENTSLPSFLAIVHRPAVTNIASGRHRCDRPVTRLYLALTLQTCEREGTFIDFTPPPLCPATQSHQSRVILHCVTLWGSNDVCWAWEHIEHA